MYTSQYPKTLEGKTCTNQNLIPFRFHKVAGKLPILTPLKTCVPEKVGVLYSGVKSGKYNGTPKKRGGVKSGHFPSHFYYTTVLNNCMKSNKLNSNLNPVILKF